MPEDTTKALCEGMVEENMSVAPSPSDYPAWRPIGTAPKDGTLIIVYHNGGAGAFFASWGVPSSELLDDGTFEDSGKEAWCVEPDMVWGDDDLSHWMILPDPPED